MKIKGSMELHDYIKDMQLGTYLDNLDTYVSSSSLFL